jgi:F-type H+-transporting ATPase subunit b
LTERHTDAINSFFAQQPEKAAEEQGTPVLPAPPPRAGSLDFSRKRTMEILRQLGELFGQAVPTVLMVFLFYLFLRAHFFRPLERVLDERRARSEGAWREAESNRAAAQEKVRARQEALKKARVEIYAEQETARRAVLEERTAEIRAARGRTSDEVRTAKEAIFADLAKARAEIEAQSPALAGEIARVILERRPPAPPSASEAR